eukprot:569071-Prorocentrum_minimum.AAC.2
MASSLTDLCSALADLQAQVSALDGNGVSNNAEECSFWVWTSHVYAVTLLDPTRYCSRLRVRSIFLSLSVCARSVLRRKRMVIHLRIVVDIVEMWVAAIEASQEHRRKGSGGAGAAENHIHLNVQR